MIEPIDRLETAIEQAESMGSRPLTVTILLTEIVRQSSRGFTDSEATGFADRLEQLIADCRPLNAPGEYQPTEADRGFGWME